MKIGLSATAAHFRNALYRLGFALLLGGLASAGPALAADPQALKDVLGKVQTDAEKKAVEDLVDKLKGVARKPAPAPAAPPAATPAAVQPSAPPPSATTAAPAPATLPPPEPERAPTAETPATPPDKVASPAPVIETPTPAPTPPPAVTPETAITSAEQKQVPSVDIEVFFAYNSAEVAGKAVEQLTTLGRALTDVRLADDAFLIAGHTDAKGGADFNAALSQRRAEAVIQFLVANFNIDKAKLVARGYGFQHLKNRANPRAAENRRVQIVNLSKDERR